MRLKHSLDLDESPNRFGRLIPMSDFLDGQQSNADPIVSLLFSEDRRE